MTRDADRRPPSKMPGQVETDEGGRPVVDDGGRPVIADPAPGPTTPAPAGSEGAAGDAVEATTRKRPRKRTT